MTVRNTLDANAVPTEIARLVTLAGQEGEADNYPGKRDATRYADALQLEVTMNPECPSDSWGVSMQDISTGGLSFWSKRKIAQRTDVWVREFSSDNKGLWMPARVTHCTIGIRGHLIGAAFVATRTQRTSAQPSHARVEPAALAAHAAPSAGRAPNQGGPPRAAGTHARVSPR